MPWVRARAAADIDPGAVTQLSADGHELVGWRDSDGRLCVMDERCPHQWSSLADEGFVDGDELVCRAHFWRFGRDGRGTKVSVLGRRDEKSAVQVYPSRERDGSIDVLVPD